jgi:hypothetical protein
MSKFYTTLLSLFIIFLTFKEGVSQNVGVGTAIPNSKLEIKGQGTTSATSALNVTNFGVTSLLFVRDDGNVGIGTASPASKLSVGSTSQFQINTTGAIAAATGITSSGSVNFTSLGTGLVKSTSGTLSVATAGTDFQAPMTAGTGISLSSNTINSYWTFNTNNLYNNNTGNVGIGSTSPAYKLDVAGTAGFNAIHKIGPGSNNPERGAWNPLWTAIAAGKPIYNDEEFANGSNSVAVYNNSGGSGVQHFWENGDGSQPNTSGKWIRIENNGNATSPGYGGFYQTISSRRNATFVQRFRAKLPIGYSLAIAENSQGTNNTSYWLTSTAGTGKWEEYIRVSHCGNTGTFSSGGHVYVTGSSNVFTWYLASCNVYEVNTPYNSAQNNNEFIKNQSSADQSASFRISGNGLIAGNVGIGTVSPGSYKLNVQAGSGQSLFESSNDAPLEIKGTDTWSGIKWTDPGGTDYIWYHGTNKTFAIGGGGSNVSGKKLHVDGGLSVGANFDGIATPTNGLVIEGTVRIAGGSPAANKVLVSSDVNGNAIWDNALRVRPLTENFTVGGDVNTFYPIVFQDLAWSDGPMELEIVRSNVHTDAQWRGALQAKFRSHATSWGHGADFINAEIYYSQQQFIARYEYNYQSSHFIVWLRGGCTYIYRTNNTTVVTDYSTSSKSYNGNTYNSQTTIESYVNAWGMRITGNIHITGKFKSNGVNETSDSTFKTNVQTIVDALDKVKQIRGVTYNWKADEYPDMNFDRDEQLGFIAQEVEKILPEVVETDQGGYKSIEYSHIVPLLIEALKEQQVIIKSQQEKIDAFSASSDMRLNELEEKIGKLYKLLELEAKQ